MNNYKIISIQGGREAYGLVSIWVLKYESMEHWGRNWQGSVWLCWMVQYDGVFVTLKAAISHSRQCFCASSSSLISTFIFTFKEHFENWPNKPNLGSSLKMPWVGSGKSADLATEGKLCNDDSTLCDRFNWKSLPPIPRQPWESGADDFELPFSFVNKSFEYLLLQISLSLCSADYQVSCAVGVGV